MRQFDELTGGRMILANGCPKSGTHLLLAYLARAKLTRVPGLLECWYPGRSLKYRIPEFGLKHQKLQVKPGKRKFLHGHVHSERKLYKLFVITIFRDPRDVFLSAQRRYPDLDVLKNFYGKPFMEVYQSYLGWKEKSVFVRYEDLEPLDPGLVPNTSSWSGKPCRWQDMWSDKYDHRWKKAGGDALLKNADYSW